MKNVKRETDGRYALTLSTRNSVRKFESRQKEIEAKRQERYNNAIANGLTPERAEEEMWLFA
jgi:hypothetical protein